MCGAACRACCACAVFPAVVSRHHRPPPCADTFNEVRQKRYDAFQAAFDHVAKQIDPIYKV